MLLRRLPVTVSSSWTRRYATKVSLLDDLAYRGLVHDFTHKHALNDALARKPQSVYAGVDPTAQSLHIGHLIPLICLLHFHIRGHTVIPLVGGATGRIGDPSGRTLEREPAKNNVIQDNVLSLTQGIHNFFKTAVDYASRRIPAIQPTVPPRIMNNLEWHQNTNMLDFLQHVGVHARVNTMLNRESVRARLASQQGLSFTEFTYQLLQAYDFYHLHTHHACSIQIGGSDQWGNILAGLDFISRLDPPPAPLNDQQPAPPPVAFGITTPLLTTASGDKFGKSAGNAVWLDPTMTSVFDFYQYFIKVEDADVEKYLKLFTLLSWSEITQIMETHLANPEKRTAQRRLAAEVTEMVHTPSALSHAQTLTNLLFSTDHATLSTTHVLTALHGDPRLVVLPDADLLDVPIFKLAARHGLAGSTSAARALVQSRGLYVNNCTVPDLQARIDPAQLIDGRIGVLRAGKDKLLILVRGEKGS